MQPSLHHLLRCAAGAGPCLLLVRERGRRTFGALCSELRALHLFGGLGETDLLDDAYVLAPVRAE